MENQDIYKTGFPDQEDGQVPGQIGFSCPTESAEIARAGSNIVSDRTPEIIAHEINEISGNVKRSILNGAVQIGIRLEEAKQMVPHGEWEEWVTTNTEFSTRNAQNLMQLAKEYSTRMDIFGNLSVSQATALLGLGKEEQEQLAREHESDTIKELKAAVEQLKAEKAKMQVRMDELVTDAESAADVAKDEKDEAEAVIRELRARIESTQAERAEYIEKYRDAMATAQELQTQLNDPDAIPESAKTEMANLQKEADQAYEKADRFMATAKELKSENSELQEKLRAAEENLRKAEESLKAAEEKQTAEKPAMDEASAAKIKAEAVIRDIASGIPETVKKIRAQIEVLGDGKMARAMATLLRNAAGQLDAAAGQMGGGTSETA